jgi:hypothetical protein
MNETSPKEFPQVTPKPAAPESLMPIMGMLMEIQKDIGGIQADINRLNETVKDQNEDIKKLTKGAIATGTAVIIIGAIFGWLATSYGVEILSALAALKEAR